MGGFRLVEAKYPALLFKQQLDAFVQKIFPMMRDNVKKNITPMLVRLNTAAPWPRPHPGAYSLELCHVCICSASSGLCGACVP